jgi:hypothetical protein
MNDAVADRGGTRPADDDPVAVIVVHGVADQPRGGTAEAVATQLALETSAAVVRRDVTLRVRPCKPAVSYLRWEAQGLWKAMQKSFFHSLRSDFLDPRLGGEDSEIATGRQHERPKPLPTSAAADNGIPLGVRFTDFLIAKTRQAHIEAQTEDNVVHTAARFDIEAKGAPAGAQTLSVFEMYWADLSRLPGFVPQIVAELFTLLFDLVRVGGQAVGIYAASPGTPSPLGQLARWHRIADQLYTRALATLMLQLGLCALVVVLASAVAAHAQGVTYAVSLLVAVGVAAWVARVAKVRPWIFGCVAGSGVLILLIGIVARPLAQPLPPDGAGPPVGVVIGALLLLLAAGYVWLLRYWKKRFRAVLGYGIAFGLVTASCIAWGAILHDGLFGAKGWLVGAMRAAEFVLLAQMVLWLLLALACVAVVGLGWRAGIGVRQRADADSIRYVIRTGRLGLFASLGAFVVFVTAAWALVSDPLCGRLKLVEYPALIFTAASPNSDGCRWFSDRFAGSTETFALVALMLSLVIGFVVVVLAPCIAAEMKLWRYTTPGAIGDWLTRGYRAMDRLLGWGSWIALAGMAIGALLICDSLLRLVGPPPWDSFDWMSSWLRSSSADVLHTLVIAVAGTTTGLLALGGVAAKRLKALRVPLDAALDVDVHFREFPRDAIPRVRIVERYVALLQHVVEQGFRRIVIVAHSQGTVITADLLHYLRARSALLAEDAKRESRERAKSAEDNIPDALARLGAALATVEIDLLTVGCPLRQLYAQRFPAQYAWACDPEPAELGVRRWFNAWGAADYVGRWLWSSGGSLPLEVAAHAYDHPVVETADRRDVCIGPTAHTHYFEPDQAVVRRLLVELLRPAPPAQ